MHALRNIQSALVSGGITVDTQPISPHPTVTADGVELGTADMRQWVSTVRGLDRRAASMIDGGHYRVLGEERFMVTDSFSSGAECLDVMSDWRGTRVPARLAQRLETVETEVELHQEVRLRLLVTADKPGP